MHFNERALEKTLEKSEEKQHYTSIKSVMISFYYCRNLRLYISIQYVMVYRFMMNEKTINLFADVVHSSCSVLHIAYMPSLCD